MSVVVTAAEVFSAIDAEHSVGSIQRVGGGAYRFTPNDGSTYLDEAGVPRPFKQVADYKAATALADEFVAELEANPGTSLDTLTLRKALSQISELQARLADLEGSQVGPPPVAGEGVFGGGQ